MCGLLGMSVAGLSDLPTTYIRAARQARDSLYHRGPDGAGEVIHSGCYLGHRRLSILDLSEQGSQPMTDDGGTISSCINGEIYNYQELRNEIGKKHFRSQSDSEVILHGYKKWGIQKLLDKIEGMYALSILDRGNGRIFLARDRVGIKPLYFLSTQHFVGWASEIRALEILCGKLEDQYHSLLSHNPTAIFDFLTYGYIPAPKTVYSQIQKLRPGSYLEIDTATNKYNESRYWSLEPPTKTELLPQPTDDSVAQKIRCSISQSVGEQLVSDVPVGFFLSGGIDSSIVVSSACDILGADKVKTYTIGWNVSDHDERKYASLVAENLGTIHKESIITESNALDLVKLLIDAYHEPHADSSILPTKKVSEFARREVTVVLSGDGGDELFGGYRWYNRAVRVQKLAKYVPTPTLPLPNIQSLIPGKLGRRLEKKVLPYLGNDVLRSYSKLLGSPSDYILNQYKDLLEIHDDYDDLWAFRAHWRPQLGKRRSLQYIDFHTYLPDDILTKVDRASMSYSLECRVPLLSTKLLKLAFSLPEEFHFFNNELKAGLKNSYKAILPAEIVTRDKKGFSVPLHAWSNQICLDHTTIRSNIIREFGYFQ